MVDANYSVLGGGRNNNGKDETNVLDAALNADDNEILNMKGELSNVQITVGGGGAQLGSALGSLFEAGKEGEEEEEDENEKEKKEEKVKTPQKTVMTERDKLLQAKKHEDERKAMRERKRKELEQKFLKERFAERKKLNAAKRGMDPRAFEEVRKKIHKIQTDRMIDDSDGKFEMTDQELDAAIEEEQRTKQAQSKAMKRQVGQLVGMTQKLMAGIPKAKQQQMSQMMGKLGLGKFDRLMQRMVNPKAKAKKTEETENHPQKETEKENTQTPTTTENKQEKETKAAKKRAKRQKQNERRKQEKEEQRRKNENEGNRNTV